MDALGRDPATAKGVKAGLPKIQKKERGEEKGSGEALPDCALVICR